MHQTKKVDSRWCLDSFVLEKQNSVSERSIKLAVSKACLVGWVLYGSQEHSPTLSRSERQQRILPWHLEISPLGQKGSFLAILSLTMPRQKLISPPPHLLMPLLLTEELPKLVRDVKVHLWIIQRLWPWKTKRRSSWGQMANECYPDTESVLLTPLEKAKALIFPNVDLSSILSLILSDG